ncbi:MAG: hypothetical protein GOU97_03405 [Nanoarchaeota archaeon]|nr:hypothetical protein [Nanoarchaeota archaeon]
MVNNEELVEFLKRNQVASVTQTAKQFGIDEKTAFSLLLNLEVLGKAKRVVNMIDGKYFAYAPQKKQSSGPVNSMWEIMRKKGIV